MDQLPPELDQQIHAELRNGEQLLWTGQPIVARMMRPAWYLVPFGVIFTGFSLSWISTAWGMSSSFGGFGGADGFLPLFGLPFVLVGIGLIGSPWWLRRKANRTVYALTSQRAITRSPNWTGGLEVRSYALRELVNIVRRDFGDGSGDLVFEERVTYSQSGDHGLQSHVTQLGFIGIPDAREVEAMIDRARGAATEDEAAATRS